MLGGVLHFVQSSECHELSSGLSVMSRGCCQVDRDLQYRERSVLVWRDRQKEEGMEGGGRLMLGGLGSYPD